MFDELKRITALVVSSVTFAVVITIFIYQNFTTKLEAQAMQSEIQDTKEIIKDNKEEILKRLDRIENKLDRIYGRFR